MATEILKNIQEEVTCPICLELLSEPLSLDCGHSFCQSCITANSQEFSPAENNSCPVCSTTYEPRNMRPNLHLSNVASRLREVKLSSEMGEKNDLCAHHGEKLLLFCKEDWKFICWLCERSQEHRDHHTFLIEDVTKECQKKLQESLDSLREKQQKAEVFETALREEKTSWKKQIDIEIQSVQKEFKQMRDIIDVEELKELQKLRKENENIFYNLEESEKELVQQKQLLQDLIIDMEHTLQASTKEMLQNVNDIIKRSETLTLRKPKSFPLGKRKVFQAPNLGRILQELNELKDVQRYWVQMDLKDPGSNPGIAISSNGREVKLVSYQNISCNSCCNYVLGSQAIRSGKYYWEVDVSEKQEWVVGVHQITQQVISSQSNKQVHQTTPQVTSISPFLCSNSSSQSFQDSSGVLHLGPPVTSSHFFDSSSSSLSFQYQGNVSQGSGGISSSGFTFGPPAAFSSLFCSSSSSQSFQYQGKVSQGSGGISSGGRSFGGNLYSQSQFSNPHVAQHVCSTYEPKFGYWVIGLQNRSRYNVFVDSSTSNPGVLTLSMTVPPCRIGVFVDYEARTVSFYNVTHHGFLIYQFSSCCFTHEIVPYFNLKNCFVPMKLCSPNP